MYTFDVKNFIGSLSWSIFSHFFAIRNLLLNFGPQPENAKNH